jgi:pimeloyl-ACP methyl ester carboxylesterase
MPVETIGTSRVEYQHITGDPQLPTLVMLHEGLGSVSMWKDFPQRLAKVTRSSVVAYSRHGYGRSAPLQAARSVEYMHDEALIVLPQFLDALGIVNPILFGHSDGGSIALIHAGGSGRKVAGIVALAPHVFVEEISVTSIAAAKIAYETTDLRERLARYHDDVDGAFWGWNNVWLSPAFRAWNIGLYLPHIQSSVLAMQGAQDEYGTMEQIDRISRATPNVELSKLDNCGHSPHRDQPDTVLAEVSKWTRQLSAATGAASDRHLR